MQQSQYKDLVNFITNYIQFEDREEIGSKGRLDIIHIIAHDFLETMASEDYEYLHFLITEHLENVDPAFPDRKQLILNSDYYDPDFIIEEDSQFEDD